MPHLDLSDHETAALIKGLADTTGNDRYRFSPRIPDPESDPRQTQTPAGPAASSAAEALCAAEATAAQRGQHGSLKDLHRRRKWWLIR
jgi:hypothetical protein